MRAFLRDSYSNWSAVWEDDGSLVDFDHDPLEMLFAAVFQSLEEQVEDELVDLGYQSEEIAGARVGHHEAACTTNGDDLAMSELARVNFCLAVARHPNDMLLFDGFLLLRAAKGLSENRDYTGVRDCLRRLNRLVSIFRQVVDDSRRGRKGGKRSGEKRKKKADAKLESAAEALNALYERDGTRIYTLNDISRKSGLSYRALRSIGRQCIEDAVADLRNRKT